MFYTFEQHKTSTDRFIRVYQATNTRSSCDKHAFIDDEHPNSLNNLFN